MKEETLKRALEKAEEIIAFYGEIIDGHAVFLHVHGINESDENIEKGKRLRSELASLKAEAEIIKSLSGEKIEDVRTITTTGNSENIVKPCPCCGMIHAVASEGSIVPANCLHLNKYKDQNGNDICPDCNAYIVTSPFASSITIINSSVDPAKGLR
jgi:hypothetical protein